MKKKPKAKAAKRRPVKQTSDAVSSSAARLLRMAEQGYRFEAWRYAKGMPTKFVDVTELVKRVAASCLTQDEVKGRRKK